MDEKRVTSRLVCVGILFVGVLAAAAAPGLARSIGVTNATIAIGQSDCVQVKLNGEGDEHAMAFSAYYNSALLTYVDAQPGADTAGGNVTITPDVANGRIDVIIYAPAGTTFTAGESDLLQLCFQAGSFPLSSSVCLADGGVGLAVVDSAMQPLACDWLCGSIAITGECQQVALTTQVTGGNGTLSPTSGTYCAGSVISLTATPNTGYKVKAWTGTDDDTATTTTNTVTLNADQTVTVEFEQGTGDDPADDCNDNGVDDAEDIAAGTSEDCDENGVPDECQADTDADGVINACDNCPSIANADQADADANGIGDACEDDGDCNNNGVDDAEDIAAGTSEDCDENGVPDECQADTDADGVINACDNCPTVANADQADADADGTGDACETSGGGDTPSGGTPSSTPAIDTLCGTKFADLNGQVSIEATDDSGRVLATIQVTSACPGEYFAYCVTDHDTPGPGNGTFNGFGDDKGLGRTLEVTTNAGECSPQSVVCLKFSESELSANGLTASNLQIFRLDVTQTPWTWQSAGTNAVGQSEPTATAGDYGYTTDGSGNLCYWVVTSKLSTFAVGQKPAASVPDDSTTDDSTTDDTTPPDTSTPGASTDDTTTTTDETTTDSIFNCFGLCGAGAVEMMLLGMVGLVALKFGSRRYGL